MNTSSLLPKGHHTSRRARRKDNEAADGSFVVNEDEKAHGRNPLRLLEIGN